MKIISYNMKAHLITVAYGLSVFYRSIDDDSKWYEVSTDINFNIVLIELGNHTSQLLEAKFQELI